MSEEAMPYGEDSVNAAIRPLTKVLPFRRNPHKVWITAEFLKTPGITAEEKGLLAILAAYMDKSYCCSPTHPQLLKHVGFGHCKLEKMLDKLRKMDLLWWDHYYDKWGRRRNLYRLTFYRKMAQPTPTNQVVATPSKAGGKHIAIDIPERVEEKIVRYKVR